MSTRPLRTRGLLRLLAVTCLVLLAVPAVSAEEDEKWKFKWDNGFKLDSPDKSFSLKFGGRIQADWGWASGDDGLESTIGDTLDDFNGFRRARLFISGTVYEYVVFKAQYDFAGGDADFKDVYVGFRKVPGVGNIWAGHFKELFSLEELTSAKYITFLERSFNNTFAPSRNTGIGFFNHVGDRFTWGAGFFRESDDFGTTEDADGKLNWTTRLTGLPVYADDGKKLFHVGLSVTDKDLGSDPFRWRTRPDTGQGPRIIDTEEFMADGFLNYNVELAGVFDRFWFAAEYTVADGDNAVATADTNCSFACLPGDPLGDPSFDSYYVQAGVFLTKGDYRRFKPGSATFDRTKPEANLGDGGTGAWEVAVRLQEIDLIDEGIAGGEAEAFSLGVNWYPNPVTRVMLDYTTGERSDIVDGDFDVVGLRLQVDF